MELENKDILERSVSEKMCSSGSNGVGEICSPGTADTLRDNLPLEQPKTRCTVKSVRIWKIIIAMC